MSIEALKSFFDVGTVVLLFLAFAFGAGVLITGNIINARQSNQLRQFDKDLTEAKTELGKQQERAANAERSAADAKKTAEGFRLDIAKSNERAAEADQKAAEANERAGTLEKDAASLNKKAELERLERVKLAELVQPRFLSLEQQSELGKKWRSFAGRSVVVSSYGLDAQGTALAEQIASSLESAKIHVYRDFGGIVPSGEFDRGIHVRGTEDDLVNGLVVALSEIGKLETYANTPVPQYGAVMGGGGQPFPSGTVTVAVGVRPVKTLPAK